MLERVDSVKETMRLIRNRTFAVVEAFKGYPNTMAFFAGNEIINDVPTSKANPPYIRVSLQWKSHSDTF